MMWRIWSAVCVAGIIGASMAALFCGFSNACRADEWTPDDTKREIVFQSLAVVDWAQARTIAKNPDQWIETNKILGEHPSVGKVDAYFLTVCVAHALVSNVLPTEWRKGFQYVTIGFEGATVARNFSLGIKTTF